MLSILDFVLIFLYFVVVLAVGFFASRKESKEEFLIGDRKLKTMSSAMTIVSSKIGGGLLLTYTALVYVYGLGAIWFFVGMVFGYILFYFFAKKIKRLSDEKKYYTLPDFFFDQYGKTVGYIVSAIVFVTMFGWVIVNFIGGAKILSNFANIGFELSTVIVGVVILIYLMAGGFKAVVKTDIIQFFGIFLLFFLMGYLLVTNYSSLEIGDLNLFALSIGNTIPFFMVGIFFPMASAELWQRVYATENLKTLKKSLITSSVIYTLIGIVLLLIGLVIRAVLPGIDPDTSLVLGLSQLLPPGLAGLGVIVFYSAIMSSADTFLFTSNATLVQDIIINSKEYPKEKILKIMRFTMFLLMIVAVLLAVVLKNIIDTTSIFVSLMLSLGFVTIILWMVPKLNKVSIILALSLSFLSVIVGVVSNGVTNALITNALSLSVLGILIGIVYNRIKIFFKRY